MTSSSGQAILTLAFRSIHETQPGAKWQSLFRQLWPAYEAWFFSEGETARPPYLSAHRALRAIMPELEPTYGTLCELTGGGDRAARFLSLYCPPPYLSGCSQLVWNDGEPALIRNYDYAPWLCEGALLLTAWNGRRVIAMSDCAWGVLDGMNEDGLAVSLSFGGRRAIGVGFGAPLLLRYVLEFCTTVAEAARALARIPVHTAYNVTMIDRGGHFLTLFLAPDHAAVVRNTPFATNHQTRVEMPHHAAFTRSVERQHYLRMRLGWAGESVETVAADFLKPPLYATDYQRGFGTIYSAIYRPGRGAMELRWPGFSWRQSFHNYREEERMVRFPTTHSSTGGTRFHDPLERPFERGYT
jgi:predicted choloylglycine hydrolase